jgi:D-alanyl-D-alanine carboxypeptidase
VKHAALAVMLVLAGLGLADAPAAARPAPRPRKATHAAKITPAPRSRHDGAHARVAINQLGDLRPGREIVGRRDQPLTIEEDTAREIEKLLRGPLRYSVTGLYVADARTGAALFAVNADDALNPASNVKMISTATALELLGADFKYPTRLYGAPPVAGVVRGDAYLLGSYPGARLRGVGAIAGSVRSRMATAASAAVPGFEVWARPQDLPGAQ